MKHQRKNHTSINGSNREMPALRNKITKLLPEVLDKYGSGIMIIMHDAEMLERNKFTCK